jgi:hypothetical protein
MMEIALVLGAVAAAGLAGLLAAVPPSSLITAAGLGTLALGLLIGVPTGFWYHVILYRVVSAKVPLPPRWWVSPARLHHHLTDAEQRRIRPWYRVGGVGFVLSVLGGLAAIAGLLVRW